MHFRDMRRRKQELSREETLQILDGATSGVLSVIGDGGYPYGVPLSFVRCGSTLYFHCATSGHKLDAIRSCAKASFTVIAADDVMPSEYTTYFKSVIAFGRVRIVEDAREKLDSATALGLRYNPADAQATQKEIDSATERMHMLAFEIEHITGKEAIELVREHG